MLISTLDDTDELKEHQEHEVVQNFLRKRSTTPSPPADVLHEAAACIVSINREMYAKHTRRLTEHRYTFPENEPALLIIASYYLHHRWDFASHPNAENPNFTEVVISKPSEEQLHLETGILYERESLSAPGHREYFSGSHPREEKGIYHVVVLP